MTQNPCARACFEQPTGPAPASKNPDMDVALGTWHNLAIEVDFAEGTYSFFVDGDYVNTFDFEPFEPSGVVRRATLLTYAAPDTAKNKKADHAANFDNFSFEVVPEEDE